MSSNKPGKKDFRVIMADSVKMLTWNVAAGKKSNSMLGTIRKEAENKTVNIVMLLLEHPHLEYCMHFWVPYLKMIIIELEKGQK